MHLRFLFSSLLFLSFFSLVVAFPNDLPDIPETPDYPTLDIPTDPLPEPPADDEGAAAGGGAGGAFGGNVTAAEESDDVEAKDSGSSATSSNNQVPGSSNQETPQDADTGNELVRPSSSQAASSAAFGVWIVIFVLAIAVIGIVVWIKKKPKLSDNLKDFKKK